jgi:hypothetical protein
MRALTVLAALALGSVSVPASAAVDFYGVQFERTFVAVDPRLGGLETVLQSASGVFSFDNDTNLLLTFKASFVFPTDDYAASINTVLASRPGCDLLCFIGAVNEGNWRIATEGESGSITFSFGEPLNASVTNSLFLGRPPFGFAYGGLTRVSGTVPEPGTWLMMLLGFGAIGASMRRFRGVGAGFFKAKAWLSQTS